MIGELIFSIITLKSNTFRKGTAYLGIVAALLLFFAGDLGTTFFSPSNPIAISISIGYLLWMIWFYLIARRLYIQAVDHRPHEVRTPDEKV